MKYTAAYILICFLMVQCSPSNKSEESESLNQTDTSKELGLAEMEVAGNKEAKVHFREGLLLLHSFEYKDAREAFIRAQEADPDMPMTYWGEAMTYHQSLWRNQQYEKGRTALEKLAVDPDQRVQLCDSELERRFMKAVNVLYGEEELKNKRDMNYREFMESFYEDFPDHHEVAAFYALSLLGSVTEGRDEVIFGDAARVVQGILKENPQHPGALHYLIHSYDDPGHAKLALEEANSYSKVAPDAAHALHMPSHIYVALGMWDEVINSNVDSYLASVNKMQRNGLDHNARSFHAFHWLLYGLLQKGNIEAADTIMDRIVEYNQLESSTGSRAYYIAMKAAYLVETEDWDSYYTRIKVNTDDLNLKVLAVDRYIDGCIALARQKPERLQSVIDAMQEARESAEKTVVTSGIPVCSVGGWSSGTANQLDIDQSHVMEMELRALYADAVGNIKEAEQWLKRATTLEENISYAYGPPEIVKPSHELYAEWLTEQNRLDEAADYYQRALYRAPGRRLSSENNQVLALN
jgi:tetratricopeptide (TPR) repeat protein